MGSGELRWIPLEKADPSGVLAFRNGGILILVNFSEKPVPVPAGATVLLRSDGPACAGEQLLPRDCAAWIRL